MVGLDSGVIPGGVIQIGSNFNFWFARGRLHSRRLCAILASETGGAFDMASDIRPLARADELVVRDMDSEVLIYDLNKDEAITLNLFAAAVWRACDGTRDVDGLVAKLHEDMPGDLVTEESVWRALDMLSRCDLLQQPVAPPALRSRRDMVRALGRGAIAVPIVAMITVPTVAQGSSCGCVTPGNCITQVSCPSVVNCNGSGMCAP